MISALLFNYRGHKGTSRSNRATALHVHVYMYYYNRHAQDPQPIAARVTIRMRLLGQSTWTIGVCTGRQGPQSYGVKLGETEYRHNCRQNIYTEEMPNLELTDPESREAPTAKTDN